MVAEKERLKTLTSNPTHVKAIMRRLETKLEFTAKKLNTKANKKISFHSQEQTNLVFTKRKRMIRRQGKKTTQSKKKTRDNYIRNRKQKRQDKLKEYVEKIKEENIVVNLSDEEVPPSAYLFLSNGLGFVPTRKTDLQDLKYDTLEFIRKLE